MEPLDGCYKKNLVYITQDNFRKEEPAEKSDSFNPEHPDTLDKTLMEKTLVAILNGETVNIPKFDYESNKM